MSDPKVLELTRLAAGKTQTKLAIDLKVTQPFISQIESGERPLPEHLLEAWAAACDVAPSFLRRGSAPPTPAMSAMVHRRMRTLPAKPFQRAVSMGVRACMEVDDLFAEVELESVLELPRLPEGVGPADAAAALRRAWRIPDGPIPNLTQVIEAAAIPVIALDELHEKHSAISQRGRWVEWLIATNAHHAPSRRRFSLAHELGHIVLGHDVRIAADDASVRLLEQEADAFAAALLLPEPEARRELRIVNMPRLVNLKQRWKVSIQFLIHRAKELELITSDQATRLYIQLSSMPGGRRNEPAEFEAETPMLVKNVIGALQETGLSIDEIAGLMRVTTEHLRRDYLQETRPPRLSVLRPPRTTLNLAPPI